MSNQIKIYYDYYNNSTRTSLMGTLFQKVFSIGIVVAVCLGLLKTEIKQEKWLLRCVFLLWQSVY